MPPRKRIQRTRLNTLVETEKTKNVFESFRKPSKVSTIAEELSDAVEGAEIFDTNGFNEEGETEESQFKLRMPMSRTSIMIEDYLQFKAARCIQKYVRAWLCRRRFIRYRFAAIAIQKEWRRFYCQRLYFHKFEVAMQERIQKHFYRSAQKIQALWRGWWVRHYIHDHSRLINLQLLAGEDLLYCVAFKLHHLLRTHQIPGIYSLRNSKSLSHIERLLASLTFINCNQRSIQAKQQRQHDLEVSRRQHKNSAYGTKIPYAGPDLHNLCAPKCLPLFNAKDADMRMSKILNMYLQASRAMNSSKKKRKVYSEASNRPPSMPTSFCSDVVNSMKKWKIIKENDVHVNMEVFKRPQNVENFVKEIESKLSLIQGNCYCRREFVQDLEKKKKRLELQGKVSDPGICYLCPQVNKGNSSKFAKEFLGKPS